MRLPWLLLWPATVVLYLAVWLLASYVLHDLFFWLEPYYSRANPLVNLVQLLVVPGTGLCVWGCFYLARKRGFHLPVWSRWLVVLPVAMGVYLGIFVLTSSTHNIVFFFLPLSSPPEASTYPLMFVFLLVTSIAGSYGSVWGGARAAPTHRVAVAAVVAIAPLCLTRVWCAVMMIGTFGMLGGLWASTIVWSIPWFSALIAAIVACLRVRPFEINVPQNS
jgi:hypothetical protein